MLSLSDAAMRRFTIQFVLNENRQIQICRISYFNATVFASIMSDIIQLGPPITGSSSGQFQGSFLLYVYR